MLSAGVLSTRLAEGWSQKVGCELSKPYFQGLLEFLNAEAAAGQSVFPPEDRLLRALELVDFDDVKVVILGQDPYHGDGQANGLAFAVSEGVAPPPSLVNIFKEIAADLKSGLPCSATLEGWARQGVLLLNTVLSVRAHEAFSHREKGWETFTARIIEELNARSEPVVFLLWGAPAQKKQKYITAPQHLVLKAPHPSPLSAYRGFLGCRHFSEVNAFLNRMGCGSIDWTNSK
jgi:uracil-DNA glycosylase